jgi:hypothetical protein
MCKVQPSLTTSHLQMSAEQTTRGEGIVAGLPGVEADAHSMDDEAHKANRELASRISAALAAVKPNDKDGHRFVLGWRLYPNRDHPFWQDAGGVHNCGCGCGCASQPPTG